MGSCESNREEGVENFFGANTRFAFFRPADPPPACYSPSSPVQILEDPNYFFPDFPLYSGRHEASVLTVEANSTIREKVGKFFYWHLCWKSKMILCVSFLAVLHNFFSIVILKTSIRDYWLSLC